MHSNQQKLTHFKEIFFIENNLFSSYVWVIKIFIYKELATGNWFNPFSLVCQYTGKKVHLQGTWEKIQLQSHYTGIKFIFSFSFELQFSSLYSLKFGRPSFVGRAR